MTTIKKFKPKWIKETGQNFKKTDRFYLSKPWRALREQVLRENNYLCKVSEMLGEVTTANIVDHWRPRKLFPELELDRSNLVPMSNHYHNVKRRIEKDIYTREQFEQEFITRWNNAIQKRN
jgi:5-methylcytosine-specific restriction endonuclease McrA